MINKNIEYDGGVASDAYIFIEKKQKCTLKIKSNQILLFNLRKRFLVHGILMNINMLSALELNKFHQMTSKWWEREKKPQNSNRREHRLVELGTKLLNHSLLFFPIFAYVLAVKPTICWWIYLNVLLELRVFMCACQPFELDNWIHRNNIATQRHFFFCELSMTME